MHGRLMRMMFWTTAGAWHLAAVQWRCMICICNCIILRRAIQFLAQDINERVQAGRRVGDLGDITLSPRSMDGRYGTVTADFATQLFWLPLLRTHRASTPSHTATRNSLEHVKLEDLDLKIWIWEKCEVAHERCFHRKVSLGGGLLMVCRAEEAGLNRR